MAKKEKPAPIKYDKEAEYKKGVELKEKHNKDKKVKR